MCVDFQGPVQRVIERGRRRSRILTQGHFIILKKASQIGSTCWRIINNNNNNMMMEIGGSFVKLIETQNP
jgi:hypothetical protein